MQHLKDFGLEMETCLFCLLGWGGCCAAAAQDPAGGGQHGREAARRRHAMMLTTYMYCITPQKCPRT